MASIEKPNMQSLFIQQLANGNVIGTGTGFISYTKAGPVLLTNRHVVTGRHNITNDLLNKKDCCAS